MLSKCYGSNKNVTKGWFLKLNKDLEHLQKFCELLIQFSLFQALRVRDWDSRFSMFS